jgi:hypothetical protein
MPSDSKYRRFYVQWWSIRQSTLFALAILLLTIGVAGGAWVAYRYGYFGNRVEIDESKKDNAQLVSFEGDVRITRSATRQIEKVSAPVALAAGDTIQTLADGRASVKLADGSTLSVRPNSTVVIRANSGIFGLGANVRLALNDGTVNLKTEEQDQNTENIVEVRQVENKVGARTEAIFGVNQTTNSGEIKVSRGSVQSTAPDGRKLTVNDSEYVAVQQNGSLSEKEKFLDAPKLIAPVALEKLPTGDSGVASVTMRWQKIDNFPISHYRVEVANTPFFVANALLVAQDPITTLSLTVDKIKPGTYYWRVRANASTGQAGEWSEPSRFTIVGKEDGETLKVSNWQVDRVGGNIYLISGRTSPGSSVTILGRTAPAFSDGTFRVQVSSGSTNVDVLIIDEHGKRSRYRLNLENTRAVQTQ